MRRRIAEPGRGDVMDTAEPPSSSGELWVVVAGGVLSSAYESSVVAGVVANDDTGGCFGDELKRVIMARRRVRDSEQSTFAGRTVAYRCKETPGDL
ncbi:unnamed protein product [Haemonchus placei]|uniref:Uncharacterized protein n=1 Tax=Haemonchus placei TaxID=6290 RepID=A0A0N4VSS7_HAEPC|nr:unnamed protein product [Haemonchus placei]